MLLVALTFHHPYGCLDGIYASQLPKDGTAGFFESPPLANHHQSVVLLSEVGSPFIRHVALGVCVRVLTRCIRF